MAETVKKVCANGNEIFSEYGGVGTAPQSLYSGNGPVPFISVQGHTTYRAKVQRQARSPSLH